MKELAISIFPVPMSNLLEPEIQLANASLLFFKFMRGISRALFLKLNLTLYFSAGFSITSVFLCGLLGKKLFVRDKIRCSDCLLEKELGETDGDVSFRSAEDRGLCSID